MPHILQDILIIFLASYATLDNQGITIMNYWPVTVGLFAGLIMGDLPTAMTIAGTFQLMSLGVAGLGGASVPDYGLATIVGIYLSARTGAGLGAAVAVGLPVGLLTIQLDVLIKIVNNFIAHKAQAYAHAKEFNKMRMINWLGPLFFALKNFIPMILIVTVGPSAISALLKIIPKWLTNVLQSQVACCQCWYWDADALHAFEEVYLGSYDRFRYVSLSESADSWRCDHWFGTSNLHLSEPDQCF